VVTLTHEALAGSEFKERSAACKSHHVGAFDGGISPTYGFDDCSQLGHIGDATLRGARLSAAL
jgi:hypothetical protein